MEATEQHLLLVDDEENVLHSLQRLLRKDGYVLHLAKSVEQAFDTLARQPVHVVLSDQRMPEQTGTEFLSKVKDLYPATVRLMLSGYTEVSSVTDAINQGAIYKFLTKPWDEGQLRANIREAFQRYKMEAENTRLHRQVEEMNAELLQLNHVLELQLYERNRRIDRDVSVVGVMQEMMDYVPMGLVGVDSAGEVICFNACAGELLGDLSAGLPASLMTWVQDILFDGECPSEPTPMLNNGRQLNVEIKPMGQHSASSGCLLLLHAEGGGR